MPENETLYQCLKCGLTEITYKGFMNIPRCKKCGEACQPIPSPAPDPIKEAIEKSFERVDKWLDTSPAQSQPENPYICEQHEDIDDCCPECVVKVAWQEGFETGKASRIPTVEEIENILYKYWGTHKTAAAIVALIERRK